MQSHESFNSYATHIDRIKAITCDTCVYNTHSFSRWSTSTDDCPISVIPINPPDNVVYSSKALDEEWKSIQSIHDWRLAPQFIKLICVVAASGEWEYLEKLMEWIGFKGVTEELNFPLFLSLSLSQFKVLLVIVFFLASTSPAFMSLFRAQCSLSNIL